MRKNHNKEENVKKFEMEENRYALGFLHIQNIIVCRHVVTDANHMNLGSTWADFVEFKAQDLTYRKTINRLCQQHITQNFFAVFSQFVLLIFTENIKMKTK